MDYTSIGQKLNCTKLPALGLLVCQEVTRHSMRSSTSGFFHLRMSPFHSASSQAATQPLLLQTGHRKVRQQIEPQDLVARGVHCMCSSSMLCWMPSCNTCSGTSNGPKTWAAPKLKVVSVASWSLGFQTSRKAGRSRTSSRGLSFYIKQASLQLRDLARSIPGAEREAICRTVSASGHITLGACQKRELRRLQ